MHVLAFSVSASFQSTPSGGKATVQAYVDWLIGHVSIHAFRGEGDERSSLPPCPVSLTFQSTPSGGKATRSAVASFDDHPAFQSTPSGGKATATISITRLFSRVSIHAFRGEGDVRRKPYQVILLDVSIHAFRGEGDRARLRQRAKRVVSIHAFRGEGDCRVGDVVRFSAGFNPRLPGGRRPHLAGATSAHIGFNPRLPGGRRPRRVNAAI